MKLLVLLLLVAKCSVAPLLEHHSQQSPPIGIVAHDPLWIIKPDNVSNPVPSLRAVEEPQIPSLQGFENVSDHHPITSQSGFVLARPQVAGAR